MMENKQPTQEQINEFWEWCGWKKVMKRHLVNQDTFEEHYEMGYWRNPDGGKWGLDKQPDLNNIFRWAVPELKKKLSELRLGKLAVDWLQAVIYDNQDPVLALFFPILEVIHGN
jgi:hypothetical protein